MNPEAEITVYRLKKRAEFPSANGQQKLVIEKSTTVLPSREIRTELVIKLTGPVILRGQTFSHETRIVDFGIADWDRAARPLLATHTDTVRARETVIDRDVSAKITAEIKAGFRDSASVEGTQSYIRFHDRELAIDREIVFDAAGFMNVFDQLRNMGS